jgi:hypothetical protein
MKRKFANFFLLSAFFLILSSCGADCKQIQVEKVDWHTRYEYYSVDTLVGYTMHDYIKLTEWSNKNNRDKHSHLVTIKNTNKYYANSFAIEYQIQYNYDNKGKWTYTTDYIEIPADSEHTFSYEWYGARGTFDSDFNVNISVLQHSNRVTLKKRIDELIISSIKIDNCSGNPDEEQAKYYAIKALYEKQLREGLIKMD